MGELEARQYTEEDLKKIKAIWKYLKQGFKHRVAYQKASAELQSEQVTHAQLYVQNYRHSVTKRRHRQDPTSAANLAHALAEREKKVLLIDLDPQSSLSISLGVPVKDLEKTIYNALTDNDEIDSLELITLQTAIEGVRDGFEKYSCPLMAKKSHWIGKLASYRADGAYHAFVYPVIFSSYIGLRSAARQHLVVSGIGCCYGQISYENG